MGLRLNANQLKLIAAVSMVIDHVGYFLFPDLTALRWIGRLAFPLFAFFIAEGCYYTRNIWRYLGQVGGIGLICMAAVAAFDGRIYGNTMITFALSILIVAMVKQGVLIGILSAGIALWICLTIEVDYGFTGVLIPAAVWAARIIAEKRQAAVHPDQADSMQQTGTAAKRRGFTAEIIVLEIGMIILSFQISPYQWISLCALFLLLLYDGSRGKKNLKWFFYFFYPVHILIIQAAALLL